MLVCFGKDDNVGNVGNVVMLVCFGNVGNVVMLGCFGNVGNV